MASISGGHAITALRLEGVTPSVAHRTGSLEALMAPFGKVARLDVGDSRTFWRAIRDVKPLVAGERPLWRISTAPTKGHAVAAALAPARAEVIYDWAGGLLWVALPPSDDAGATLVRRVVKAAGGHATLIRAPSAVRAVVEVFEPQEAGLAALTRRVKDGFDPRRILNPGRMWAGA
jgi:glycolate oxidase FAD binding subunit